MGKTKNGNHTWAFVVICLLLGAAILLLALA